LPRRAIRRVGVFLQQQLFVVAVGIVALAFVAAGRVSLGDAPRFTDTTLLQVLFALLVAVEALRESRMFDLVVAATIRRFRRARSFALAMLVVAGLLAALLTNDVALFIVIPFTLAAGRMSGFDVRTVVALEVVAANLLGSLTPLGNPQNLFVYHQAGWSATGFMRIMLPFVLASAAFLVAAIWLLVPRRDVETPEPATHSIERWRATTGIVTLLLVILEILRVVPAWPAAALAAVCLFGFLRHRIGEMGLSIVPLFFFAFIIVEGLRSLGIYELLETMPASKPEIRLYLAGLFGSQVLSNVPMAILLSPVAEGRWIHLLYGVNAGGCGTIIASLANLLGWRIYRREKLSGDGFFRILTLINVAALVWIGSVALALAEWMTR
jgi:Na+/H+ antiporter NhaD/arsenite permease-like protein